MLVLPNLFYSIITDVYEKPYRLCLITDVGGIPDIRGGIEAPSGWRHLSVPSDPRPAPRPAHSVPWRVALRHRDMEVRARSRLLQRPNAVSPPCNAQHMPRHAYLGEVHQ